MRRYPLSVIAICAMSALDGCKMGPNYKRPIVVNNPATCRGIMTPDVQQSSQAVPLGAEKWQAVFTDLVLQEVIREALKNNYDVKIAADHVLEQQAQLGITRAAQFPTLTGGGRYDAIGIQSSLLKSLNNNGSNTTTNSNTATHYYSGGLTASAAWNLDFWGLYRRQTEAQRAYLRATEWAKQTTYSTIVEDVATDYYELRTLDAELEISKPALRAVLAASERKRALKRGDKVVARVREPRSKSGAQSLLSAGA